MGFLDDDRGAAEPLSAVLSLGMLFIFLGSMAVAFGAVGDGAELQQQKQIETEGQQLKGSIQEVDRMVRSSGSTGPIGLHIEMSERIGNNRYTVQTLVEPDGDQYLIIEAQSQDIQTKIRFHSDTPVAEGTVEGGDLYIVRKDGESSISVVNEE